MQTYTDAASFLARAQPFFEAQELVHGSILGMMLRLRSRPEFDAGKPYLATFETSQGDLALAAAMLPNKNLVLAGKAGLPHSFLDEMSEDLHANGWAVAGVLSIDDLARRFAQTWQCVSGQSYELRLHMRAYEVRRVIPPERPPAGSLRLATQSDIDLLVPWRAAFGVESLHEPPPANLPELVAEQKTSGKVFLWENGRPVSTAGLTRPTPKGIWINAVYTPPEFRGRGYASICVAELSQQMLNAGKSFVALYADIEYPQSNRIYQKMGYLPVEDFSVYIFR
jgi:uncharacterized protein